MKSLCSGRGSKLTARVCAAAVAIVGIATATPKSFADDEYGSPQPCEAQKVYEEEIAIARGDGRPEVSHLRVMSGRNYEVGGMVNEFDRGGRHLREVYCPDKLARGVTTTRSYATLYTGPLTRLKAPNLSGTRIPVTLEYFYDFFTFGAGRWRKKQVTLERRHDAWVLVSPEARETHDIFMRINRTAGQDSGIADVIFR